MRDGVFLMTLGCAPFAAGALLGPDGDAGLICPFRSITGMPCPFCGATRAFALAARGDAGFLRFNAVWVLAALVAVVAGAALLLARRPLPARAAPVAAGLAIAAGWAYALVQRAEIVS